MTQHMTGAQFLRQQLDAANGTICLLLDEIATLKAEKERIKQPAPESDTVFAQANHE